MIESDRALRPLFEISRFLRDLTPFFSLFPDPQTLLTTSCLKKKKILCGLLVFYYSVFHWLLKEQFLLAVSTSSSPVHSLMCGNIRLAFQSLH